MMTTVDHLKRLCIDHYFHDEIEGVVDSCVNLIHSHDLLEATLSMRLMREAGYCVSAGQ
jgi:(3S)-linalool synthase